MHLPAFFLQWESMPQITAAYQNAIKPKFYWNGTFYRPKLFMYPVAILNFGLQKSQKLHKLIFKNCWSQLTSWNGLQFENHWNKNEAICGLDRAKFGAEGCWLRRKRTRSINSQAAHNRTSGKEWRKVTYVCRASAMRTTHCGNSTRSDEGVNCLVLFVRVVSLVSK